MTDHPDIERRSVYIHHDNQALFTWVHSAPSHRRAISAVICNPLGVEYMSGHRSIRHMADSLAGDGIETVRFDYRFTGDSSGGEFSHASVTGIIDDIRHVVVAQRKLRGDTKIVLIGIGLGATFAALAAESCGIEHLVLWNPTVSGKRFVREQKLLSVVIAAESADTNPTIDVAGVLLTPALQEEFSQIDLAKLDYSAISSILLINRYDRKANSKLVSAISSGNTAFEQSSMSGYKEMMDQPTETVVPTAVIKHIGQWIVTQDTQTVLRSFAAPTHEVRNETRVTLPTGDHTNVPLIESAEKFGHNGQLFGIATFPQNRGEITADKRAFLFLNCGSEHHAGPHRMYTILARRCASFGALSFRFDIEGIGDSVSVGNNEDNNSYSPVALDDISRAIEFLSNEYGCTEFILNGICAGAYHSFITTAKLSQYNIVEANLINPLVFEWNYDDPNDHLRFETHTYRASVRNPKNWRRLFSGKIDYRRLLRSFASKYAEQVRRAFSRLIRRLSRTAAPGLPRDVQAVSELGRKLTLVLSEGDPGLDIMYLQAGKETRQAIRSGVLSIHELSNANHGLSKKHMQDQLIAFFVQKYSR